MIQISLMPAEEAGNAAKLIQTVWNGLTEKEWFIADDELYFHTILQGEKGIIYQAVDMEKGILAGVFFVVFPGLGIDNLGRDIGFQKEELLKVVHMDSVAILPSYRGSRLQVRLMQTAEEKLRELGYTYLMCTVHPENCYSRDNLLKQGYQIVKTGKKYGDLLRHILLKKISPLE